MTVGDRRQFLSHTCLALPKFGRSYEAQVPNPNQSGLDVGIYIYGDYMMVNIWLIYG